MRSYFMTMAVVALAPFALVFACGGSTPAPIDQAKLASQGAQEGACIAIYEPSNSAITACRQHVQAKFGHASDAGADVSVNSEKTMGGADASDR